MKALNERKTIVTPREFREACLKKHQTLRSPVMMLFASDHRPRDGRFFIHCIFLDRDNGEWDVVETYAEDNAFDSLSKDVYSSILFEREIKELFGLEPKGGLDTRRLRLHDEVWPEGHYPLRKDFNLSSAASGARGKYAFTKVEGEGIFEVPVGPVHAGIIGPGHFRFSCAGEPVINLELRLGFTHRGVEKMFENARPEDKVALSECVAGDSAFAHGLAFCSAVEKISGIVAPERARYVRAACLELERMYNHVNDIGGIATDVGFGFPANLAAIIKESLQRINQKLTGSRFLKGINAIGGIGRDLELGPLPALLLPVLKDFNELKNILHSNVSFMDRVDTTGTLDKKTAEDLGIIGPAGRASGVDLDLRKISGGIYEKAGFNPAVDAVGDVLARLNVRIREFEESVRLIKYFADNVPEGKIRAEIEMTVGSAIGSAEGWRGPVLYFVETNGEGKLERVKIVDPSFRNWQALSFAILGNIIPDFPLCNKSFDLSYPGGDL
ncbi:MAG TPA: NADH-quinone oxidoreductase subunit C [Candidatus Omnitrophota bacterium]|nr:NADH-quinone oxidoreductase subunit C [Candidatus Omnitrophota bacterium]